MSVRGAVRQFLDKWKLFVLVTVVAVSYYREPLFFHEPRLWAEEATWHFASAFYFSHSPDWYRGLLTIQRGYFSIWPNIATTLAANLPPLEHAPLVTTLMALLVQLIPHAIILWSRSALWKNPFHKLTGILIILFTPLSGEVWLNTVNSQFHLSLAAFLLLIDSIEHQPLRRWVYRLILFLGGSTGLATGIFSPLFFYKAWVEKSRERMAQGGILAACALGQIAVLISNSSVDTTISKRFSDIQLVHLFPSIWVQSFNMIFSGVEAAQTISSGMVSLYQNNPHAYLVSSIVLSVVILPMMIVASRGLSGSDREIFVLSYFLLVTFSYFGALVPDKVSLVSAGMSERYFYVPNVILLLLLMAIMANSSLHQWRYSFCCVLLILCLAVGMRAFPKTVFLGQANWRQQVKMLPQGRDQRINIWPDGWSVVLKKP